MQTVFRFFWDYQEAEEWQGEEETTNEWREEKTKGEDRRWQAGWIYQSMNICSALLSEIKY